MNVRVLHVDPEREWRGGERQVFLLARELRDRGIRTAVACDPRGELHARARGAGIAVEPLPIRGDADPAAIGRLVRRLRQDPPDILHLHTARAHGAGGLGARLAGFRPVLVTRRVELDVHGGFLGRWKYRALADHYIAISRAVQDSLERAGVSPGRIDRIPSGVESPPAGPARAGGGPDREWTVATLAAFSPQKDPETWLRTALRLGKEDPSVRFVWAGGGELPADFPVRLHEAGLSDRVSFPGFLKDAEPVLARADVFFLPSAFEALGTVLLDAAVRGIPIVATDVGGIAEVIRHEKEGLLVPKGDAAGLAQALLRIRRDPGLAARLGAAARARAADFGIGKVVDRIVQVYDRLSPGGKKGPS